MTKIPYTIRQDNGADYVIWVEPGQLISLRMDEALVVPPEPQLAAPLGITLLNDHERRIKWLESIVAAYTRRQPNIESTHLEEQK